jgi:hypothetical protein
VKFASMTVKSSGFLARRIIEITLFSLSLQSIHWNPWASKSTSCSDGSR